MQSSSAKLNLIYQLILIIQLGLFITVVSSGLIERRSIDQGLQTGNENENPELLEQDIEELENAIEREKERELAEDGMNELTPEQLDVDVAKNNEGEAWYHRLAGFLRDNFHNFVKGAAKWILSEAGISQIISITKRLFAD